MKKELFLALVIVSIFTHLVRLVYEILKHKQVLKPGKLSFVIILINMLLLWVSWVLLCCYDIYKIDIPNIIRYAGITFAIAGGIIFLTGLVTIKTLESYDGDLITTGIYSKIRHPMYLAFIIWLFGFPVFFEALFALILSVVFIANVLFWRYLEEKELEKRFPTYLEYKKKTVF